MSLGLGILASLTLLVSGYDWTSGSWLLILAAVIVAVGLTLAASEATRPLRRRGVRQQVRRNG